MHKFLMFCFVLLMFSSCNKENYGANDDFLMTIEVPIVLEAGLTPNIGVLHTHEVTNIATQIESYLAANNSSIDQVAGIYPRAATITSVFQADLDFMQVINIILFNSEFVAGSEGFYHPEIPNRTGSELSLYENNQVNVLKYLKEPYLDLYFESRNDGGTNNSTEVKLKMNFGIQLID